MLGEVLWFDVVFQYYTTDIYKAIRKATGLPPGMGHKYYKEWRVMTPAEKASKKGHDLVEKSRRYYERIRAIRLEP